MKRLLFFALLAGCNNTTGSKLVTFFVSAAGPADVTAPVSFTTGSGYQVMLTRARLHIAALYLNQSVPTSGAQESSCVQPGIYVGEAFGPVDVDLLSPAAVAFPGPGEGTETEARTAEVWLAGGSIDALDDTTVILDVAGTASRDTTSWPFDATVTIGQNRALPVLNPATPGSNPICHQRIVTPIVVQLLPTDHGQLTLTVDPRGMFNGVDFAAVPKLSDTPLLYRIPDEKGGPGGSLFKGLTSNAGVYTFTFQPQGE